MSYSKRRPTSTGYNSKHRFSPPNPQVSKVKSYAKDYVRSVRHPRDKRAKDYRSIKSDSQMTTSERSYERKERYTDSPPDLQGQRVIPEGSSFPKYVIGLRKAQISENIQGSPKAKVSNSALSREHLRKAGRAENFLRDLSKHRYRESTGRSWKYQPCKPSRNTSTASRMPLSCKLSKKLETMRLTRFPTSPPIHFPKV